ncbi:MAG: hypothetical protein Q9220_006584 [cf. Caloplaca sp. 1 TL-2023]
MAAAPQFAAHPGAMASHAGMPHGGHPMAQGHPSQQGMPGGGQQPGITMPQQMHIGPGGSQPGQQGPMMGGMMPGAGPGASSGNGGPSQHAMSHLAPGHPGQMMLQQQQQQMQQMQQAMANNPQLAQQYQQQQQIRRMQMQQQQTQQQIAQGGGIPMGPGNHPMNAAQFRANQANPNLRPPASFQNHLQQQQAQISREQQQQQQQQHHAQQQQQQQQQNQAIAQQMAIQQAASQAGSNQSQPAPQQQPRPPSQMAGGPDGQAVVSNQQHSQMQQQHSQQQPQAPQQAQASQQSQQQPQQQNQPSNQQQAQQQMQSQQPQGQPNNQQHHQAQQAQAQAQHAQAAAAMLQNRMPNFKGGHFLKLLQFGDQLGSFSTRKRANDLRFWQMFVDNFFSHAGVIRQQLYYPSDQSTKQYEISPTPTLARYYWTQFNSGVQSIQMILQTFREHDLPNGGHTVTSEKSSFIYWLTNGHQLVTSGGLKVQFDAMSKIEVLEILTTSHEEFVPRAQLLRSATESPEMKHSPNQSKATGKKGNQQRQKQAQAAQDHTPVAAIPHSTINDQGVTPSVQQFLEIAEAMSLMQPLFKFSQSQPGLPATEALRQYNSDYQTNPINHFAAQQQQHHQMGQQQPGGGGFNPAAVAAAAAMHQQSMNPNNLHLLSGAGGGGGQHTPNHFVSPANSAHLTLPGGGGGQTNTGAPSPATLHGMSPAMQNLAIQQHMQQQQQQHQQQQQAPTSVGMVHSASQPGTNNSGSQGPSANASPNMTNKRRRASAVKGEDDGGGGGVAEMNGVGKVRPSPRIGGKRQKGGGGG